MKILWVTPYGDHITDGLATYAEGLYRGFQELEDESLDIRIQPWNFQTKRTRFLKPLGLLWRLVQSIWRSEVVHVQYMPGLYLSHLLLPLTLGRLRGVNVVMTFHEQLRPGDPWFRRALSWLHYTLASRVIVHSQHHRSSLPVSVQKKTTIIPHLVRRPPIQAQQVVQDENLLVVPGFINPWKGIHVILRAMPHLLQSHPELKLLVAGKVHNEQYFKDLQEIVVDLSLGASVQFQTSFLPELAYWSLLARARLVLLPYQHITMSGVLNDTFAVGTALLTSTIPPFQEVEERVGTSFCVGGQDPEEWACAIRQVIDDVQREGALRDAASRYCEEHSPRMTAKAHRVCYS